MKKIKNNFNQNILMRLFKIGLNFRFWFFICLSISIFLSLTSSYKPIFTSKAIDFGIVQKNNSLLMKMIIWIAISTFLEVILQYLLAIYSNLIAQNVIYNLRIKLYRKMIYFKTAFFDQTPNGMLVARSVSDLETIATIFNDGILMIFGDVFRIIFLITAMFYANWILAIISFIILPIMYFFTKYFQNSIKQAFTDERHAYSKLNSFIEERLSGMNLIQLFNRQKIEKDNFKSINNEVTQAHLKTIFFFPYFSL